MVSGNDRCKDYVTTRPVRTERRAPLQCLPSPANERRHGLHIGDHLNNASLISIGGYRIVAVSREQSR